MMQINLLPPRCSHCGSTGPFPKNRARSNGLSNICKACTSMYGKRYYRENAAKVCERTKTARRRRLSSSWEERAKTSASGRARRAANPIAVQEKRRAERYGMSQGEYDALFDAQQGLCASCGTELVRHGRQTQVDHDHVTGKVRGLLCGRCNRGIAMFREDPAQLEAASAYLRSHKP